MVGAEGAGSGVVARMEWFGRAALHRRDPLALLKGRRQKDGRPTAYVCRGRSCSLPIVQPDARIDALR